MQLANLAEDTAASVAGSLCDLQAMLIGIHVGNNSSDSGVSSSVGDLIAHISQLADTISHAGLTGLQNVQVRLTERLLPLKNNSVLSEDLAALLEEWVQLNFNYLAEPRSEHWLALIDFLDRPVWNEPLSPGQIGIINRLFEISSPHGSVSLLTADELSGSLQGPIIDAHAATIIAASLEAITSREALAITDSTHLVVELDTNSDIVIPPAVNELVAMIRDELAGCADQLHTLLETAATDSFTTEHPSLEDYRWQVERLASATEALGLKGMHEFLARILEAACLVESGAAQELPQHCEIFDRWPALAAQYLNHVGNPAACQALVDYITAVDFALPFDIDAAQGLNEKLLNPELELPNAGRAVRPTEATEIHVTLAVPEDIHLELLDSLLHELPAQTQEFSAALQRIASGVGEVDDLRLAQRIAHTLKGSANTVGIRGIAELSHHLEDIFIAIAEQNALPPPALARTLVDAADCLEAMSDSLLGVAPAPTQAIAVLQAVLDWANRIDREGLTGVTTAATSIEIQSIQPAPAPLPMSLPIVSASVMPAPEASVEAEHIPAAAHEIAAAVPTLRVATTHIDDLLRLSGESKIIGGQLKEGVRRVESQLLAVRRQHQLFQQLVNELEQLVDIRGITSPTMRRRPNDPSDSGFDALEMDQYSELHTVSRRLTEAATDSREWSAAAQNELNQLEDMLLSQTRHSNETQESILKMRMVPASSIVGRLQRGVRQTSRLLDKEVELTVKGAETLVDSDSLNQLIDPLMHLMRNAIDHGIESAEQRVAHGKQAQGHLIIEFGRDGNQIFVRCTDDGRGLDYAAIRTTAETRQLIVTDAVLTESQLARLILEPGFSTKAEVTQVSGRGIGLDIVHSRVLELKGSLDVQSEINRGCRFLIRLPATLISAHALLVRHGKHTVAIASRGVRQILDAHAGKVSMLGNRLSLQVGQEVYEAHRLETLLGQTSERRTNERAERPALLVEVAGDRVCAILVQAVIDTIDLVVKPLGPFVPRSIGLIGATILGDGSVAPVMDLPDVLRASSRERLDFGGATGGAVIAHTSRERHQEKMRLPSVLVVDDSLSVRRSMEQLLRDSGYEVRLARDGLEAVSILEAKQPDILLVDLEMPRMNGMELTVHVRNRAATRHLPVIMITSRATDKHRKQAETAGVNHYMTKPYAEDALLERMTALLKQSA